MATRYFPVGVRKDALEEQGEETFSDVEIYTAVNDKQPHRLENGSWKRTKPIVIAIIVLVFFLAASLTAQAAFKPKSNGRNSPVPQIPTEEVVFGNYSDYSAAPTIENNVMWMDLLGSGMGFVSIKNPSQYGLANGVSNPHMPHNVQNYGVSMYHQIHCLMMIRTLYWQALRGDRTLRMAENDGLEEEMGHVNHCFDYIRQGIMCAGDMSIEGAADERDGEAPHISGVGMKHECKSWKASRKWMDENLPAR
ncbi:hypothetical protein ONS95_010050 [Cadophora gregata]|uniref:uncharacterized protein n=1 Tax=Cadophora gregata TaxID=51156 RepID=UPI0026DCCF73|nr:uncharacterized protein ONS95_010050 [Cadophora gregata]KAK0121764.1 hypothetical protein ONS95_010050 [Cadophora gregata]